MRSVPELIAYYFSGTGNSWRLAEAVAQRARSNGESAVTWRIERGLHPGHDQAASHAFLFPVYAFGIPPLVRRFLRALPPQPGKPAFVAVALGDIRPPPYWLPGYEGNALCQARSLLKRKGYAPIGEVAAHAPENWVVVGHTPDPQTAAAILDHGLGQVALSWRQHAAGRPVRKRTLLLWRLLLAPVYFLWLQVGRRISGKSFSPDERCNGCGLCARLCPARIITLVHGRPRWNWKCENCMRCIGICPQSAIQVSWLLSAAYTLVLWEAGRLVHPVCWLARADLSSLPWGVGWASWWLAYVMLCIGLCTALGWVADRATGWRPFRALLGKTHYTRRLRRYLAPGFADLLAGESAQASEANQVKDAGDHLAN